MAINTSSIIPTLNPDCLSAEGIPKEWIKLVHIIIILNMTLGTINFSTICLTKRIDRHYIMHTTLVPMNGKVSVYAQYT